MIDSEEERTFSAKDLEKLSAKPVLISITLVDHAGPDGHPLVVEVLETPRFWIQYSRKYRVYRVSERKAGQVTSYERGWRPAT